MPRKAAAPVDVKENEPADLEALNNGDHEMDPVMKAGKGKKVVGGSALKEKKKPVNKEDAVTSNSETEATEDVEAAVDQKLATPAKEMPTAKRGKRVASASKKEEAEPVVDEAPEDKVETTSRGGRKMTSAKKGKPAAAPAVAALPELEEEEDVEEAKPAAKGRGGRKGKPSVTFEQEETEEKAADEEPAKKKQKSEETTAATKGGRGKKAAAAAAESPVEEEKEEEEEEAPKPAAKGRGRGKKAPSAEPVEEEDEKMEEDAEKAEAAAKPAAKGRGRGKKEPAAKPVEEEDEKMEEDAEKAEAASKPAAKGRGRGKMAPADEKEEPKIEEEQKESEPVKKGRGRGKKVPEEKDEEKVEEEEKDEEVKPKRGRGAAKKEVKKEEEKEADDEPAAAPVGRAKRGAAAKGAAAAKKAAEEEVSEKESRPKKGAKAVKDEEEKKPTAKGRGKGKKAAAAAAAEEDEDGPSPSKKIKEEEEEPEEENGKSGGKSMTKSIRRVQVKGRAAVDPLCTLKSNNSHVYEDGDLIYDVMLNQTNIGNNNNKYYIIQLLEDDSGGKFSVWFRWGRVGYDGQNKLVNCGNNLQMAIKEFSNKFEAKTRNEWPTSFDEFQTYAGKYTMIEMDYGNDAAGGGADDVAKMEEEQEEEEKKCQVVSKLDARVQELMHLMCSIKTMAQAVREMEFDAEKSPLGKLTQHQIKEGYACLKKIEEFIGANDFGMDFKLAVNEYYTKVPHACGFRPPAMIRTPQQLKNEIELLDLLSGIEYAIKTMKQEVKEEDVHPVDRHYASLKCELNPMEKEEEEYELISEYLAKTHASTHHIQMNLKNVYRVEREGEEDNEAVMEKIGNRKLLWHGSRLSNFFGILSQGLRIAPPEAPCTGYMFGKGVYFADMASKSGNYCYTSRDGETGFLLLAEVALGSENRLRQADYNANKLPSGKHSTWGMGRTMPDPELDKKLNNVIVPCGEPIKNPNTDNTSLLYNEFIVYNTQQIRMRYLLEVEFNQGF